MSEDTISPPQTDKGVDLHGNDRGTEGHYSGEEFDSYAKDQPRFVAVGAGRDNRAAGTQGGNSPEEENIPPDVGKRAFIDEENGEVHGSGAGAGGVSSTEEYDAGTKGAS